HPVEQVLGDTLNAFIRALRLCVDRRANVPRGCGETVGPPNRGGVEDEVALRARVDRGGIEALRARARGLSARDDFEARDLERYAMPFPSDQAGYAVSFLHSRAGEEPVIGFAAAPVSAAGCGPSAAGTHQVCLVRSVLREEGLFGKAVVELDLLR